MMTDTPESVSLVPIDRIEVLNSRDRNMKVFEEIVENIRSIGLKKPITVTERRGADGAPAFLLVCGEGRLNAFRLLGESHIPALVVNVTDEDAFIMSLAENIARRGHRPLGAQASYSAGCPWNRSYFSLDADSSATRPAGDDPVGGDDFHGSNARPYVASAWSDEP